MIEIPDPSAAFDPTRFDAFPWAEWRTLWTIPDEIAFLNHGAFGPSPRAVVEVRNAHYARLESEPARFYTRELQTLLAAARTRLGAFVNASPEDLIFCENATTGLNIVADSFPLAAGDEVIALSHEYGATVRIWERACRRAQARLVRPHLPLPVESGESILEAILSAVTHKTRLVVASHITSATALTLPLAALCRRLREDHGIATCIDGPHAIAMIDVDLAELGCDYYAASLHKWLAAPFGSGFLVVSPERQAGLEPSVLSWGLPLRGGQASWRDEYEWVGTRDPSPYLAVPTAIDFLSTIGLEIFRSYTHALAAAVYRAASAIQSVAPICPDSSEFYGSMVALALPPGKPEALCDAFWHEFQIDLPVYEWQGQRLLRVSCHLHTRPGDIERFLHALTILMERGL